MANDPAGDQGSAHAGAGSARPRSRRSRPPKSPSISSPSRKHWSVFEEFAEREQRIMHWAARGLSTKEIATAENDGENAVDQVIKRVRAKCGGVGRRNLARDYIAWEAYKKQQLGPGSNGASETPFSDPFLVDQNLALGSAAETAPETPSVHRGDPESETDPEPVISDVRGPAHVSLRLPIGIGGSGRNELDKPSSTFMLIAIATVSVFFAAAILILLFTGDHLQIGH